MASPANRAKSVRDYNFKFQKRFDKKNEVTQTRLQKSITTIERQIIGLVAGMMGGIENEGRKTRIDQAVKTRDQLSEIFQEYYQEAARSVKGYEGEATAAKAYLEGIDVPPEFTKVDKEIIKGLQQLAYGEFENLGATFQKKIGDEIYRAVLTQKQIPAVTDSIANALTGLEDKRGRPMAQYASQIAHDELMKFSRGFVTQKAVDLGLKKFQYLGSLIKDSREWCVEHAGGIYTLEEIQSWEGMDWQGKNPDVPVMVSCGGYNCRHSLIPMDDDTADFILAQRKESEAEEPEPEED